VVPSVKHTPSVGSYIEPAVHAETHPTTHDTVTEAAQHLATDETIKPVVDFPAEPKVSVVVAPIEPAAAQSPVVPLNEQTTDIVVSTVEPTTPVVVPSGLSDTPAAVEPVKPTTYDVEAPVEFKSPSAVLVVVPQQPTQQIIQPLLGSAGSFAAPQSPLSVMYPQSSTSVVIPPFYTARSELVEPRPKSPIVIRPVTTSLPSAPFVESPQPREEEVAKTGEVERHVGKPPTP